MCLLFGAINGIDFNILHFINLRERRENMIYITGDIHGKIDRFFDCGLLDGKLTQEDTLIICGDFGFVWFDENNPMGLRRDNDELDKLSCKPYTILFIDGNHENHDMLSKYPETKRYGDAVHKIRDNIYHLERGKIYTIEGHTFFTFGGAYSIDKNIRQEHISWWSGELPSKEEYERGIRAIKDADYRVDYIITHTCPTELIKTFLHRIPDPHDGELTGFFDYLMYEVDFKRWFFGHWHTDNCYNFNLHGKEKSFRAMYFDAIPLDSSKEE